jgi:hypothetical protein
MQVNQLRGLLYEFGVSFRAGRNAGLAGIRSRMAEIEEAVPGSLMCCLKDQLKRIDELQSASKRVSEMRTFLAKSIRARRLRLAAQGRI